MSNLEQQSAEPLYQVIDTSATVLAPHRQHDQVINGVIKHFDFYYDKQTFLPREIALKFLKEGFIVKSPEGSEVTMPGKDKELSTDKLAKDEVIAKLDELSLEALIVRSIMLPGGEKFSKSTSRQDLIQFLMGKKGAKRVASRPAEEEPEDELIDETDGFTDEELKSMIPDDGANEVETDEEEGIEFNEEAA